MIKNLLIYYLEISKLINKLKLNEKFRPQNIDTLTFLRFLKNTKMNSSIAIY